MYTIGNCCIKEEERKNEHEEKHSHEKCPISSDIVGICNKIVKLNLKSEYISKVNTEISKVTKTDDVMSDMVWEEPGTLSNMQDTPQRRNARSVHKKGKILSGELIENYNDAAKKTQQRLEIAERKTTNRALRPLSYTQSTEKLMSASVTPCNESMQNDDRLAKNINLEYQTTENKCTQTDFREETWIRRKTTIRHGSDFISVVSAIDGYIPSSKIMKIQDDVTAIKQLSVVRLFILRNASAGKIRFVGLVIEKMKTEPSPFYLPADKNTNKNELVLLSLCSDLLYLLTANFEEAAGPFLLEQSFFKYVVQNYCLYLQH